MLIPSPLKAPPLVLPPSVEPSPNRMAPISMAYTPLTLPSSVAASTHKRYLISPQDSSMPSLSTAVLPIVSLPLTIPAWSV